MACVPLRPAGCPFTNGTVIRCNINSDGSIYKIEDGRKRGYPGPAAVTFDNAVVTVNSVDVCTLRDACPDGDPMPLPPGEAVKLRAQPLTPHGQAAMNQPQGLR